MDTKALRQKILDLAIRGKLVPQDPNDEPASVLLERIRAEKQQMVKDGKLKAKDIKNDSVIYIGEDNYAYEKFPDGTVKCIQDEIPFELPEGWEWTRLQTICDPITDGTHKTPTYSENGYIFLSSKNVTSGKIDWDNVMYIPESLHNELYSRLSPRKKDILLAKNGTTGVAAIVDKDYTFDIYVTLALIRIVDYIINPNYLLSVISSSIIQEYFNSSLKGIGVPNLHLEHIRRTLVPVAPLQEQNRILDKIEILIPLIDTIESDNTVLKNTIQLIKSKILDLAIRGKLVPQDPNDEPASVLLDRIRAEKQKLIKQGKIKPDKRDSVIFKGDDNSYYETIENQTKNIDSEIPFDLPDGWEWCRLGNVFNHNTGKALNKKDNDGVRLSYITTSNVYWNRFELDGLKTMPFLDSEIEKCTVKKGDILVCEGGDIGRTAIWNSDEEIRIQNHIHKLRSYSPINTEFYFYMFYYYKIKEHISGKGIGIQGLSSNQLHSIIIPLPSLSEQKRIADKVTQLFSLLDYILDSL